MTNFPAHKPPLRALPFQFCALSPYSFHIAPPPFYTPLPSCPFFYAPLSLPINPALTILLSTLSSHTPIYVPLSTHTLPFYPRMPSLLARDPRLYKKHHIRFCSLFPIIHLPPQRQLYNLCALYFLVPF